MTDDQEYLELELCDDTGEEWLIMGWVANPVFAELWDNELDAEYDMLGDDDLAN